MTEAILRGWRAGVGVGGLFLHIFNGSFQLKEEQFMLYWKNVNVR